MIVHMKKATLFALRRDREAILHALQRSGAWMVISPDSGETSENAQWEQKIQNTLASLRFLNKHQKKKPLFSQRKQVCYADVVRRDPKLEELAARIEALEEGLASVRNDLAALDALQETLLPWRELDIPMDELKPTQYARVFIGYVSNKALDDFLRQVEPMCEVRRYGETAGVTAVLLVCHVSQEAGVREIISNSEYTEAVLPKLAMSAQQASQDCAKRKGRTLARIDEMKERAGALADRRHELELLYDKQVTERDRAMAWTEDTRSAFCLQGWVREDQTDVVTQAVGSVSEAVELTFDNPPEGEMPPSCTQEKKLVEPYTAVTNLYSRPSPYGIDPNPLMAPFYFLFFGMMMGDAGYGLIMTLGFFLFYKLTKPKGNFKNLVMVLLFGGISTIVWGALFGGWLGFELPALLFVPMNEPLLMLGMCFGMGLVHIFAGMGAKMYMDAKRGRFLDGILDQLTWMVLIVGLLVMTVAFEVGAAMAAVAAAAILLTGGRKSPTLIGKITGGLSSLYSISGYLSDVLSYARLFALGLTTGVVGMVINTLCGMLLGIPVIGIVLAAVVMIAGHLFNIVVNTLGAFVHTARLQYIEFFGKFYESGGRAFVPLSLSAKYIDIVSGD